MTEYSLAAGRLDERGRRRTLEQCFASFCQVQGLDEKLLESARAALREMTLLDQAREIVKGGLVANHAAQSLESALLTTVRLFLECSGC